MTIASGTYSVKASGGDYTTLAAAVADCTTQTGDLTLSVDGPITETAQSVIDHSPAGYAFRITSSVNAAGIFGAGNLISINYAVSSGGWLSIKPTGTGIVEIDHLDIEPITNSASGGKLTRCFGSTAAYTLKFHNNLFNCDSHMVNGYGTAFEDANATYAVSVNIVVGVNIPCFIALATLTGAWEHNTFVGAVYSVWFASEVTSGGGWKNNIAYGGTAYNGPHTSTPGNNNAGNGTSGADATWSSGAGNVVNLVNGAFQSVTIGDGATYLQPAIAGVLDGANTAPTISGLTASIDGYPLNCIGAKCLEGSGNPNYYYAMLKKRRSF